VGDVWTINNYKPNLDVDATVNPGGDGILIFVGLAPPAPRRRWADTVAGNGTRVAFSAAARPLARRGRAEFDGQNRTLRKPPDARGARAHSRVSPSLRAAWLSRSLRPGTGTGPEYYVIPEPDVNRGSCRVEVIEVDALVDLPHQV